MIWDILQLISLTTKVPFDFTLNFVNTLNGFLLLSLIVGETAAGKASRSLAQHIPGPGGMEGMKGAASGVVGDLARARIALDERGQKLGELEERTAAMMASADSFSKHAHDVRHFFEHLKHCFQVNSLFLTLIFPLYSLQMMLKYKDKKWYQL